MPIAAVLTCKNKRYFMCHGGITSKITDINELNTIDRNKQPTRGDILFDILWNDPVMDYNDGVNVQFNQTVGRGDEFGGQALIPFCQRNNIECIFRAHQCHNDGIIAYLYGCDHPICYTVFSIPEYEDKIPNRGGVVVFVDGEMNVLYYEKRIRKGNVMNSIFEYVRKGTKDLLDIISLFGKEYVKIINNK